MAIEDQPDQSERRDTALAWLQARHPRYYIAYWLTPPARRPLALGMLRLAVELKAIAGKVTNPTLGLLRIVWWRDSILALTVTVTAQPLLRTLAASMRDDEAGVIAEWVETFDLPFLDETERLARLRQRYDLYDRLLGSKMAIYMKKSLGIKHNLGLVIMAIRVAAIRKVFTRTER